MVNGMHHVQLNLPLPIVWSYVRDMDNWVSLLPGYEDHVWHNDKQSTWMLQGEFGGLQKVVYVDVEMTLNEQLHEITFHIAVQNMQVTGGGSIRVQEGSVGESNMTGSLHATAKGWMAPMLHAFLKPRLPKLTNHLTIAMANKLNKKQLAVEHV